MELNGIAVSEGIVIGKALVYRPDAASAERVSVSADAVPAEIEKWTSAKQTATQQLEQLCSGRDVSAEEAAILAAHREILDDEEIDELVREKIGEGKSAPWAAEETFTFFADTLAKSKNALIAERSADMLDVCARVVSVLRGTNRQMLSALNAPVILIARDLLPSETASMDRKNILGIAQEEGGPTSHSAIIARSAGIPAVFGAGEALRQIADGDEVILDGIGGKILVSPDARQREEYLRRIRELSEKSARASRFVHEPAALRSGERIQLGLNIGGEGVSDAGCCDFIGLYRSEFLYMDSDHMPTEEEQFQAYSSVLQSMNGKPVTLRTLDIGGDKTLRYLSLPHENNPFLGKRAVRLCFDEPELFRTQLRAAYRASVYGKLNIMFPMIGSLEDWRRARAFAESVRRELEAERVTVSPDVRLGIMIEIPSAAILAHRFAQEVDFASIGTNDLCQYLCAADRIEPGVREYYQPFSPAVLITIEHVIRAFEAAGKELSMCGELAGNAKASVLLAGMGLKKFSMSAASIGAVKMALAGASLEEAQALAGAALSCATQEEVTALLDAVAPV